MGSSTAPGERAMLINVVIRLGGCDEREVRNEPK
jgi:hypothetical protein